MGSPPNQRDELHSIHPPFFAKIALAADDMAPFTHSGFQIFPGVIEAAGVDSLIADLPLLAARPETKQRGGRVYGARNLLRLLPSVERLATDSPFSELAEELLGAPAFPVRGIFFDKVPGANWDVAWHQDLTIAVRERRDAAGFNKWTVKNGVPHVEPPPEILEGLITLRLHLDDCDAANGALRVVPGSRAGGVLTSDQVANRAKGADVFTCEVARGDVVAMRPLTLHSSHASESPSHRRVIHVEFATAGLPHGLEWAEGAGA